VPNFPGVWDPLLDQCELLDPELEIDLDWEDIPKQYRYRWGERWERM